MELKRGHRERTEEYLGDGKRGCEEEWTKSIAGGKRLFHFNRPW